MDTMTDTTVYLDTFDALWKLNIRTCQRCGRAISHKSRCKHDLCQDCLDLHHAEDVDMRLTARPGNGAHHKPRRTWRNQERGIIKEIVNFVP